MRQLRYSVAASLDGYIAGPNGEFDWIVVDPEIDFAAMYTGFSGLVMGRRSYDVFVATGGAVGPALPTYVYSRTLAQGERDGVTFAADAVSHVRRSKRARTTSRSGCGAAASSFASLPAPGSSTASTWRSFRSCLAAGFSCCRRPRRGCRWRFGRTACMPRRVPLSWSDIRHT